MPSVSNKPAKPGAKSRGASRHRQEAGQKIGQKPSQKLGQNPAQASHGDYWRDVEDVARHGVPPPKPAARRCDHAGCAETGAHRAPKSAGNLRDFYWFCLPHVQAYNKGWNFYEGFSVDDMEDVRRQDMVGWRPTWPLGKLGAGDRNRDVSPDALRAHIFSQFFGGKKARAGPGSEQGRGYGPGMGGAAAAMADGLLPEERAALASFGLPPKASWAEIKRRYKELALAHHPDLHHATGAEAAQAEMQIKLINRAYTALKRRNARASA